MDTTALAFELRLKNELPLYAKHLLRIRTKSGEVKPFVINDAQAYLHKRLEEQLAKTGKVRAIILKGRQQGCSTYVAARFYHKTTHRFGVRTYIMAHEAEASANLFEIVERYHQHIDPTFRPSTGATNARELIFDKLDSGYKVATAGSKGAGRSSTVQMFHGSEVAIWPNASEHAAGILQTVPSTRDSEIIFESTANGLGNFFHKLWLKAVSGQSEFQAIFVPWFWQAEYATEAPNGFELEAEEAEYMQMYGLTLEQMVWRRNKIIELEDPKLFDQEYPATPDLAFQTTGIDSFIPADMVQKARKQIPGRSFGAVVAGFDPKRDGSDRAAFIYRQGDTSWGLEYDQKRDFTQTLGYLRAKLDALTPYIERLFIDHGGSGWELGQMLREYGYGERIRVVNFGSAAQADDIYANRRAEMWGAMKGWICDPDHTPTIPDDDKLAADISAPTFKYDSRTRCLLEPKEQMKSRIGMSPDGGDALALTFAEPVIRHHVHANHMQATKARVDEHPW